METHLVGFVGGQIRHDDFGARCSELADCPGQGILTRLWSVANLVELAKRTWTVEKEIEYTAVGRNSLVYGSTDD